MTTSPTGPLPSDAGSGQGRGGGRAVWLLPAVTFLIGLAIGALLLWLTRPDGAATGAGPSPGSATGPGDRSGPPPDVSPGQAAPGATAVTVPASCLELADDVRQATALLDEAATAARRVDTQGLADLVRRMGEVRATLDREANACRAAATAGGVRITTVPATGTG